MVIDKKFLDEVSEQAKSSPRLRMNYNFHQSLDEKCHRFLNALELGTEVPIQSDRGAGSLSRFLVTRARDGDAYPSPFVKGSGDGGIRGLLIRSIGISSCHATRL